MQQSLISYLRKLRNHEFAESYELICANLVVEEELTAENVKQAIDSVQAYASELQFLKTLQRKHPNTKQIDSLRNKRHQALLSLRGRVSYFRRSPNVDESLAAELLYDWLSTYREFFNHKSTHSQTRMIDDMDADLSESESLSEAINTLNLVSTLDTIKATSTALRRLHLARLNENKDAAQRAKLIRETAFAHIQTAWKTIEVAVSLRTGNTAECLRLFDSINRPIIAFKAKYLGKTTRRENEKLKAEEEEQNNPPAPTPEQV